MANQRSGGNHHLAHKQACLSSRYGLHIRIGRALVDNGPLPAVQLLEDLNSCLLLAEKCALGLFARRLDQFLDTPYELGMTLPALERFAGYALFGNVPMAGASG